MIETDVVQPDLLYIAHNRGHLITRENIQGAPDLIVDPELESVKRYCLDDGRYTAPHELTMEQPDATLTTPLLPTFVLTLAHLFA